MDDDWLSYISKLREEKKKKNCFIGWFVNGELHLIQLFFPLAKYSQKAILKIKNPKIKCVFETFNSQN
jgi:hypothetical protein